MQFYKVWICFFLVGLLDGERKLNSLRERVYLIEDLFRNDIDDIRQMIETESVERKTFMDIVNAFMLHVNETILTDSTSSALQSATSPDEGFQEIAQLQIVSLRTAFSSLKKLSNESSTILDNLVKDLISIKTALTNIENVLSRVDDTCTTVYTSLCSCDGWWKWNQHCFQSVDVMKKWADAQAHCQSLNGHLASIEDQKTNDFLGGKLTFHYEYFIDGTDDGDEGQWTWNSTGKELEYTNWLPGQPDNFKGREHCLTLRGHYYNSLWNDYPCDMELPFVCQRPCVLP